jgi:2-polyprenyl-6-methoxyphenol hydroxylase-like FAD-dependent oxidoreductase
MSRRALIIGGSLGGLLAAHLLRRSGWRAVVFERNEDDLTGRGVGLGTHPQLVTVLRRAGIAFDASMGITVRKVVCLDRDGKIVLKQPTARTMSAWSRLYRALRAPLPAQDYRLGKKLRRIEQDTGSVTAIFEDGSSERGDLLVGADGIRSTVREQFLPQAQPIYAGYVAWRAVLDEARVPRQAHRAIFELYTFCLPEGEQLLGYPVPGGDGDTAPGQRRYNIVWYRPADSLALNRMCTDASGQLHVGGIAPPLIRLEVIAAIKADAEALLAPQLAEIFRRSDPFFQPIFDLESPALAFGRVALTGDAAFVVRPHIGAGATKAAIDATILAECLSRAGDDVAGALARFESVQLPFGRDMVALSRQQGAYLSAQLKPVAQRRGGELRRDLEAVLHAHGSRSDQIGDIVAARGLEPFFRS